MRISEIKTQARSILSGRWGSFFLSSVLLMAAAFLINHLLLRIFFGRFVNRVGFFVCIGILLTVLLLVFVLRAGIFGTFLKNARGEAYTIRDIFSVFVRDPDKFIFLGLIHMVLAALSAAPALLFCLFTLLENDSSRLLFLLFILAGLVFLVTMQLTLSQCVPLMLDEGSIGVGEAVRESARLMKGRRLRLLGFILSYAGWVLLAVASGGIGCIWILPYFYQAKLLFYKDIKDTAQ